MRLAASITHVDTEADRRGWVIGLRRALPEATVTVDKHRSLWKTTRSAWLSMLQDPAVTHALVLCDDMVPCPRFRELLLGAVAARPEDPVVIFTMRETAMTQAREQGLSWIASPTGARGGSNVLPREMAEDFLLWEQRHIKPEYPWDDTRIDLYCLAHGITVYVTAPSLQQHVGASSLCGNPPTLGGRERRTTWLADGSPVDWATEAVKAGGTFSFSKEMQRAGR